MQYVPKHFTDKSTKNAESMSKVVPLQVRGGTYAQETI